MITATNFATRIRRENYIYTLSHCRQNRARKGGHQKTYYPPSQKVIGNREVDSMYVVENSCNSTCSSFTIKFFPSVDSTTGIILL